MHLAFCALPLAAVALAACGGGDDATSDAAAPAPTTTAAAPEPAPATTEGSGAASSAQRTRISTVASGLEVPWDIAFLPDGRALVTERPGRVRIVDARGRLRGTPAARVPVSAAGEGGLLGIAVDLEFAGGSASSTSTRPPARACRSSAGACAATG